MKLVIILVVFGAVCQARHLHPGNFDPDELLFDEINNETPEIRIGSFRNLMPSRFVPLNSDIFFKSMEPCEEGFKRDVLGICREVWD